jgi:4-hydroxy-tetrahydrodipicolinate reductase
MKKTLRVLMIGSAGRMGKTIVDLAGRDPNLEISAQCDVGDAIEPAMKKSDVAIDFSHISATEEICRAAVQNRQPLVIGTTGHTPEQRATIEATAKQIPIVFASNFSVGVNTLFWLTRKTAEMLGPEFGLEIIETHHTQKKDAPSGTAKTLAEILKGARKSASRTDSSRGESEQDIPTQSIREGDVVGEHTVIFAEPSERLELTHRAGSREIFAKGAVRAAQWVVGQPPGLYSMEDVLGLPL